MSWKVLETVMSHLKIADAVAAALSPPYNCFENSKACKPFRCHSFELQETIILLQGPLTVAMATFFR